MKKQDEAGVLAEPPPPARVVCAPHNEGVEALDRVWARTELRLTAPDGDQGPVDETAEGHFQFARPGQVSLTVSKVGETYFCLGSGAERYWWMDLRRPRWALIGDLSRATPEAVALLGVPVHPVDLIDLVGILPIEPSDGEASWSADGRSVVVSSPGRWGTTRQWVFSAGDWRLEGVRILDERGEVRCESSLAGASRVEFRDDPSRIAVVPTRVTVRVPESRTTISIRLYDPQNRGTGMNMAVFNPDHLVRAYNIPADSVGSMEEAASRAAARKSAARPEDAPFERDPPAGTKGP
ncbi:MAG: hypothetical protein KF787_09570 [Phycisphaeraceae bacterium]|nr:hypothetical protein [Phycisphaerae bacterium]MBX3392880.1 hypothetical protein [Phycisphaeraceae bacterium]